MKKLSFESLMLVINVSFIIGLVGLTVYNMVKYGFSNCSIWGIRNQINNSYITV